MEPVPIPFLARPKHKESVGMVTPPVLHFRRRSDPAAGFNDPHPLCVGDMPFARRTLDISASRVLVVNVPFIVYEPVPLDMSPENYELFLATRTPHVPTPFVASFEFFLDPAEPADSRRTSLNRKRVSKPSAALFNQQNRVAFLMVSFTDDFGISIDLVEET